MPAGVETIDIRTLDGWSLRADVLEPEGGCAVGVVVLAHALMARRSEFDRPRGAGLAHFLWARGWRVVAFDFRGHGDSGPAPAQGGRYGYDELVRQDLPAVCEFARWRSRPAAPVVVVGHSLGGHVALAAHGSGAIEVDALVGIGAAPWVRGFEPRRSRWWMKRATVEALAALSSRVGRLPARLLRLGSDDEPLTFVDDLARFARSGRWSSGDGQVDYLASLAGVRIPVLQVVSEGDLFECAPACGKRLAAACGGRRDVVRLARGDGGARAPSHMGMVTGGSAARDAWSRVEGWMREVTMARSP